MTQTSMDRGQILTETFTGDDAEWDRLVRASPDATFCHLAGWRQVMEQGLGHRALYLAARAEDGALTAVLPLVRVRSHLLGDYLLSMPFLNYGGPIGEESGCDALRRDAVTLAAELGVDLLELRTRVAPSEDPAPRARKVTVLLDLPAEPELIWAGLKSKVRSQVRRAMKEAMEVRVGPDQAEAFYDVFARNMRDLGTPVLPASFFRRIRTAFEDEVVFACVYHQGQPVAAGAGFAFSGEFELTWASSLREYNSKAPNMLLYWSLMEEMARRGVATFNFGRCTPGGGTHRFKAQWGGRDAALPWFQWSPSGVAATPSPDSARYRLAIRAWQKLPLAVANRLGPMLARRLP